MTQVSIDRVARIALRHLAMAVLAISALLSAGSRLSAQGWEWTYGTTANLEDGRLRVIPVTQGCRTMTCCSQTDGYIAVGNAADDVYVVRTDNNGATIWEYTYNITNTAQPDEANSIYELSDGSGFVITGRTTYNSSTILADAFILKINCNGTIIWTNLYGGLTTAEYGRDIIEATTGTAGSGTAAGDLVVTGETTANVNGTVNGWILRVSSTGTVIWARAYQPGTIQDVRHDVFYALTEATPVGAATTGDIIAVGSTRTTGSPSGFAVRVNGNTGAIGAAPQNASTYATPSELYSVVELQNPNQQTTGGVPHAVLAGYESNSMYFVKLTGGDPCSIAAQASLLEGSGNDFQVATTIREITFSTTGYSGSAAQWDLAVSGFGINDGNTNQDAILLTISPATLNIAGVGSTFGGSLRDEAWSVYPVDTVGGRAFGFILCGHTQTDWQSDSDPGDLYLIKTDGSGDDGCNGYYDPDEGTPTGSSCVSIVGNTGTALLTAASTRTLRDWGYQVCSPGAKRVLRDDEGTGTVVSSLTSIGGKDVVIPFSHANGEIRLSLFTAVGKRVRIGETVSAGGFGGLSYSVEGLAPGVYFLWEEGEEPRLIARICVL